MSNQASTSSQSSHVPDVSSLSVCGIKASGEPAGAMNSMGERVAAMPFQRRVEFRTGKDGKPLLKDLLEGTRNTAAWVQSRGIQVPQSCVHCAAGNGPFVSCVVLRMPNGQRFADGSCANCYFGHTGSRCSFRNSSPKLPSDNLLGQFQSVRSKSDSHVQTESTKAGSTPNEGWNKRRRINKPTSSAELFSPLFVPADEPRPTNTKPAADSARDNSVSRDPRIRPAAAQKEKNIGHATPNSSSKPPPNAPRGPKDMKPNAAKNETPSSTLPPKPIQTEENTPRVICGFLESSLEPHTPPINSAESVPPLPEPVQPRPGPSKESPTQDTQPVDSSKREKNVIKCPLTPVMYNDAGQLRHAVKDLSKFLNVAEKRLEELEKSSTKEDVWEMAISELEK